MTNSVTDMCRDTSDNTWISTGSIAIVRFISSAEGQGYAFSYQSLPRNESVSGKYHDNSYKRPCSNKRPLPLFRKQYINLREFLLLLGMRELFEMSQFLKERTSSFSTVRGGETSRFASSAGMPIHLNCDIRGI